MLQESPLADSSGAIHAQKAGCNPPLRSQSQDLSVSHLVVVIPAIDAGIEQGRELAGFRIHRSNIAAFKPVADSTT